VPELFLIGRCELAPKDIEAAPVDGPCTGRARLWASAVDVSPPIFARVVLVQVVVDIHFVRCLIPELPAKEENLLIFLQYA
jgi:hypothetical protein